MIALLKNPFLLLNNGSQMLHKAMKKICQSKGRLISVFVAAHLALFQIPFANAVSVNSDNHSVEELEYGVVLFDYFQKDYFAALVDQEYAQAINNPFALNQTGQVLKGGMMLSYGMSD